MGAPLVGHTEIVYEILEMEQTVLPRFQLEPKIVNGSGVENHVDIVSLYIESRTSFNEPWCFRAHPKLCLVVSRKMLLLIQCSPTGVGVGMLRGTGEPLT